MPDQTSQWLANNMYWGLRTTGDPAALRDAFRRALREVDPDVPASAMRTMEEALEVALAPRRTNLWLVRVFARARAAARGSRGLRGDVVHASRCGGARWRFARRWGATADAEPATNRRRCGATDRRSGSRSAAAGALAAAPALRSVLFEVEPFAAGPFAVVSVTLLVAGLAAAIVAALPIRRIDPFEALRTE